MAGFLSQQEIFHGAQQIAIDGIHHNKATAKQMSSSCMLLEDNDSDDEIPPSVLFVDNKKKNKRLSLSPGENNDEDPMLPTALLRLPSAPSATCTDEESMKDKEEKGRKRNWRRIVRLIRHIFRCGD